MSPAPATSLGRVLLRTEGLAARVAWYPPGLCLQPHAHDAHQVSILLSGTLEERVRGQDARLAEPAVGIKPAGAVHANDYGPHGALLLGLEFDSRIDLRRELGLGDRWGWRARPSPASLACSRSLLSTLHQSGGDPEGLVWELVASLDMCFLENDKRPVATAPGWVTRVEQRLQEETVSLGEIARDEGLHPVYLSRAFVRWKGCRPSVLRQRARLHRAVVALSKGQALAAAAAHAGFADQSHLSRATRGHSGLSPRQLRALLH